MAEHLTTAHEVISALGGTTAVANLFGFQVSRVSNWPKRGLPPESYVTLKRELAKRRMTAPDSLWGMHGRHRNGGRT